MTFQLCQFVSVCVVHRLFWIVFTNFESASFHLPPCPLSWRILSSVCWCIRCFRDVQDQYDLYFCYLAPFLFFFFMLCCMCACACLPTNLNSEVWQQDFRCIRMNKEGEHGNLRCVTWHIKVSMCLAGTLERGKSELFHLNLWVWFIYFSRQCIPFPLHYSTFAPVVRVIFRSVVGETNTLFIKDSWWPIPLVLMNCSSGQLKNYLQKPVDIIPLVLPPFP